jgi:GT2 family glycosyltransferase
LLRDRYQHYRRGDTLGTTTRKVETLMGAAVLLPRKVFLEFGGWDEEFVFGGEDFDLSTRVGRRFELIYIPEVVIIHHGRVSTRANVAYSAPNVAIGFVRNLRKSGSASAAIALYKIFVTLDAPIQLIGQVAQLLRRKALRRHDKARINQQRIQELWYFMSRGLIDFWKV